MTRWATKHRAVIISYFSLFLFLFLQLPPMSYVVAAFAIWLAFMLKAVILGDPTSHLPTCGLNIPGLAIIDILWFFFDARGLLEYGYRKYPNQMFRVALPNKWLVIVGAPEHVEELRRASEESISGPEATSELLQAPYTLRDGFHNSLYHIPIIRNQFTKSLPIMFEDTVDEVIASLGDVFSRHIQKSHEWVSFPAIPSVMNVIARASNRAFVGLPMCRDEEFLNINTRYTESVVMAATFIEPFPQFIRPFIARLFPQILFAQKRCAEILESEISERLNEYDQKGKGSKVDMLNWMIEDAPDDDERSVFNLAMRVITLNFASIHTTSLTFLQALLHLAEEPSYQEILRKEVEDVVEAEGWTNAGIKKMLKLDSFMKEAQRVNPLACIMIQRKVLKPYTFVSGGTSTAIPAGITLAVPISSVQMDPANYADALDFKPWRFLEKEQMVQTTRTCLTFGHGRTSCPGRFFASLEMKLMLARLVWEFDLRVPGSREDGSEGKKPKNWWIASMSVPTPGTKIMLRRRTNFN